MKPEDISSDATQAVRLLTLAFYGLWITHRFICSLPWRRSLTAAQTGGNFPISNPRIGNSRPLAVICIIMISSISSLCYRSLKPNWDQKLLISMLPWQLDGYAMIKLIEIWWPLVVRTAIARRERLSPTPPFWYFTSENVFRICFHISLFWTVLEML